ncbi:MAG: fasciclin domain-containing protein [Caulobacter sp.]|nr:fasciclin domain-containing protein [Caulobacter sp.]
MITTRLLGAAAVAALLAGSAFAQTTAQPAKPTTTETTPPAAAPPAAKPTPPAATPATPATPSAAAPAAATGGQVVASGDIVDTLKASGNFTTLLKALDAANMTTTLKTHKNLTVFAPTDAAFAALPAGELDKLMADPKAMQKLLTYHVVNATVDSTQIKGAKGLVTTVAGDKLVVDGSGSGVMANNAAVTQLDVKTTNGGTLHVVDKVLMPQNAPSVAASPATTGAASDAAATAPAQPAAAPAARPGTQPAAPATTAQPAPATAPATPDETGPAEEPTEPQG